MYRVSEDRINKTKNKNPPQKEPTRKHTPPKNKRVITLQKNKTKKKRKNNSNSQHHYNKWLAMCNEIREDKIRHNTQIKAIADFLQKLLLQQQQQQSKKVSFKTDLN
jgi:hypothetical protein